MLDNRKPGGQQRARWTATRPVTGAFTSGLNSQRHSGTQEMIQTTKLTGRLLDIDLELYSY